MAVGMKGCLFAQKHVAISAHWQTALVCAPSGPSASLLLRAQGAGLLLPLSSEAQSGQLGLEMLAGGC